MRISVTITLTKEDLIKAAKAKYDRIRNKMSPDLGEERIEIFHNDSMAKVLVKFYDKKPK